MLKDVELLTSRGRSPLTLHTELQSHSLFRKQESLLGSGPHTYHVSTCSTASQVDTITALTTQGPEPTP